jgi:hypothetical protein
VYRYRSLAGETDYFLHPNSVVVYDYPTLVLVTVIALATQVPLAVTLEVDLHAETAGLGPSIWSVGLPEELAKAIPVLAVALIYRLWGRHELTPKDYLFLGAVSGLVFGASEVVHYFTVNGIEQFFQTVKSAIPAIEQMLSSPALAALTLASVNIPQVLGYTRIAGTHVVTGLYTLLLPSFAKSGWLPIGFLEQGPFGIALLKRLGAREDAQYPAADLARNRRDRRRRAGWDDSRRSCLAAGPRRSPGRAARTR